MRKYKDGTVAAAGPLHTIPYLIPIKCQTQGVSQAYSCIAGTLELTDESWLYLGLHIALYSKRNTNLCQIVLEKAQNNGVLTLWEDSGGVWRDLADWFNKHEGPFT